MSSTTQEEETGDVLIGEVSMCNDDNTDNCFDPPMGKFLTIEEGEATHCLLYNEYLVAKTRCHYGEIRSCFSENRYNISYNIR